MLALGGDFGREAFFVRQTKQNVVEFQPALNVPECDPQCWTRRLGDCACSVQQCSNGADGNLGGRGNDVVSLQLGRLAGREYRDDLDGLVGLAQADINRAILYCLWDASECASDAIQNTRESRVLFWLHLFQPRCGQFHIEAVGAESDFCRSAEGSEYASPGSIGGNAGHGSCAVQQHHDRSVHPPGAAEPATRDGSDPDRDWSKRRIHFHRIGREYQDATHGAAGSDR